jgi:hypothetical protein
MNQFTKHTLLTGSLLGLLWVIFTSAAAATISVVLRQRQPMSGGVILVSGAIVAGFLCGRSFRHGWRKEQQSSDKSE